jgi:hypothetical protein
VKRKALIICALLFFSIEVFSCELFIEKCKEDCEREIEACLLQCADWSPDAVFICNDNCVFAYVDCIGNCGGLSEDRDE